MLSFLDCNGETSTASFCLANNIMLQWIKVDKCVLIACQLHLYCSFWSKVLCIWAYTTHFELFKRRNRPTFAVPEQYHRSSFILCVEKESNMGCLSTFFQNRPIDFCLNQSKTYPHQSIHWNCAYMIVLKTCCVTCLT